MLPALAFGIFLYVPDPETLSVKRAKEIGFEISLSQDSGCEEFNSEFKVVSKLLSVELISPYYDEKRQAIYSATHLHYMGRKDPRLVLTLKTREIKDAQPPRFSSHVCVKEKDLKKLRFQVSYFYWPEGVADPLAAEDYYLYPKSWKNEN